MLKMSVNILKIMWFNVAYWSVIVNKRQCLVYFSKQWRFFISIMDMSVIALIFCSSDGYTFVDGYTHVGKVMKNNVTSLLIDPIV